MVWYTKENSRLIKPWKAASSKMGADMTSALSPNKDFLISAIIGRISDLRSGSSYTIPNLAPALSEYIAVQGWANLPFNTVADNLEKVIAETPLGNRKYFSELEIVLIQNEGGIMDEAYLPKAVKTPKDLVPV